MSGESTQVEGLQEAIQAARKQGHAAGRAEGYSAGRADAAAIVSSEAAAGRHELAAELAGDAGITPERADSLLAKSAKSGGNFAELMKANSPDVGPSTAPEDDEAKAKKDRVEQLKAIGGSVR